MLRSLISVSDKSGLHKLSRFFMMKEVEMYCSGGTYNFLREPYKQHNLGHKTVKLIKNVNEITRFPEILNGRVKTLNPYLFSGILGDLDNPDHIYDIDTHNINLFNILIVNLYPFEDVVKNDPTNHSKIIENIDIGGHSMLRAALKIIKMF